MSIDEEEEIAWENARFLIKETKAAHRSFEAARIDKLSMR